MIKMAFGIVGDFNPDKDYRLKYEPKKYHCIPVDDDAYMSGWWYRTQNMATYFGSFERPAHSFDRWGITLIPPESLPQFRDIIRSEARLKEDENLRALLSLVERAMKRGKYVIHYGV